MTKKKILKIGIVVLFATLITYAAVFFEPIKSEDVNLSFDVAFEDGKSDVMQVFYLKHMEDDFTEEQSFSYAVESDMKQTIKISLRDIEVVRIDYGNTGVNCSLNNIKFTMGMFSSDWTKADWENADVISGIETQAYTDSGAEILPMNEDPYMVWNVNDFKLESRFEQSLYLLNLAVRLFTTAILVIFMVVVLKKFEFFAEFPVEIWQSRKTLVQLSKNDFKTRFAGSYLGIVWAFVQPIVTVLVYWFVFEVGLRSGQVLNVPFVLWLIAGLVPWFFFSDALNAGTNALIEYQYLVKKVVFQISVLPLVKVISNFFVHLVFVAFTLILYILHGFMPDLYTLQIVYYSFCTFILVLALCYITSAMVGFFRDLSQIINIILQVGVWMTPIMWNMDTMNVPEVLKIVLKVNPMYYIVAGYRDALINKVWFWENMGLTMYFWIITMFLIGLGMFTFKKLRVHFADVL